MDTFLSLCETKSYTKTAAILHLTQPSVTQHIKYLEHFYQCPLFHYDGKQVEMTEAGQYLRDKVILQRAQNVEIRKRLQQMQEPISFDIGLTPSATFSFALPRLCTYVNRNAEPRIQFHVSNTRRLLRGMQNGMLDAIIMEGEIPDMLVEATELCRENIIAAASPELSEELYGCTWSTLLKQPLIVLETGCGIRTLVQRHLSRSGISLYDFREVIEVDSFIVLKELLRQGLGIAFVLEPTIQQERDEKRLGRIYVDTMPMYGSLYFVTMRDRADNEQLWKIRDVLLQKTFCTDVISKKIVKNVGQMAQYYMPDHHEGIVSKEQYQAVQVEMTRRSALRSPSKTAVTGRSCYTSKYALSDRLVCGECGTLYRRCTWTSLGRKYPVWRCTSRLNYGTKYCHDSPTIKEEPLPEFCPSLS